MLIQTSKSLNYGQRKPRQWGPISAVRYAVRVNAERMGIPDNSLYKNVPFWEGAGNPSNLTKLGADLIFGGAALWNGCYSALTDGSTNYLVMQNDGQTLNTWAVRFLAKPTFGAWKCFFGCDTANNILYTGTDNNFQINLNNSRPVNDSDIGIRAGVWNDVVMQSTTGLFEIWVNGVKKVSNSTNYTLKTQNGTSPLAIGAYGWGSGKLQAEWGSFQIFTTSTLPAETIYTLALLPYALLMPVSRPAYSFPSSGAITLTIANCIAASSLSTTTLVEKASLIVQHLTGLSAITNISLQAGIQLLVDSLSASSAVEQAALVQKATLAIANAASTSTLSNTALLQASILAVASAAASSQLSNVQLSEAALLTVNSLISATLADNINFTTAALLSVQSLSSATALQLASLLQKATLQLASLSALTVVSSSDLTQHSTIAPTGLTAASSLTTIDFASGLLLSLSNLTSYGSLTAAEIVQKSTLAIEALQSISSVQTTTLAEAAQLAVNSLVSAGLLSPTALEIAFLLTVDNLGAASIIQNVSLGDVKFQLQLANLLSSGQLSSVNLILPSDGYCLVLTASSKDFTFTTLPINFTLS